MLFSTNIFCYCFLPSVIIVYFIVRMLCRKSIASNIVLLIASIIFYLWGMGKYTIILLASILANYFWGLLIDKIKHYKKQILFLAVVFNVAMIVWFKYFNFILDNILYLKNCLFNTNQTVPFQIILPIGISFFTFQALSYVIDVYRGTVQCQKNIINWALYISFFPQLIAGPIVRYSEVNKEINERHETLEDAFYGGCRFCIGLAKKVLIADVLGQTVDSIFNLGSSELSSAIAWSGLFLYTLQIYFDFSGYSDMAIGMARIFGFKFGENFVMPYTAKNVTEFWKRWHISLSSFFMDYVYIPLGGNRKGNIKTYRNLAIVFLLCGLWHGAAWTFLIWGAYHGIILVLERILKNAFNYRMSGLVGNLVTLLLVMFGWLIFRSATLAQAGDYVLAMFGWNGKLGYQYYTLRYYLDNQVLLTTIIASVLAVIPLKKIKNYLEGSLAYGVVAMVCLFLCMLMMSNASFNAFIYFQF